MTSMLERAAKAIAAADGHFPWEALSTVSREDYADQARAVLLAVRAPDKEVVMAGAERVWDEPGRWSDEPPLTEQWEAQRAFTVMIDAILAQPSTPTDVTPA